MALIPVFGLITGGLARTDVSVSYSGAVELATSVMNGLLSDGLPFESIPDTPDGQYRDPAGSVAGAGTLDPVFADGGWTVDGASRLKTVDNIRYRVELWSGPFLRDADLAFGYLQNPDIDFNKASPYTRYYGAMRLTASDFGFSPYNPTTDKRTGSAWATAVTSKDQWALSADSPTAPHDRNQNLKKVVLRISAAIRSQKLRGLGENEKEFWLVSFRANLGGR